MSHEESARKYKPKDLLLWLAFFITICAKWLTFFFRTQRVESIQELAHLAAKTIIWYFTQF